MTELSAEKIEQVIEKVATEIIKRDLDTPALITLEAATLGWPATHITAEIGTFMIGPFIQPLFDDWYNYSLTFTKRENLEKLIEKINECRKEEQTRRNERENNKLQGQPRKSNWFRRLFWK